MRGRPPKFGKRYDWWQEYKEQPGVKRRIAAYQKAYAKKNRAKLSAYWRKWKANKDRVRSDQAAHPLLGGFASQ